ncbi:MAG: shikimate kinase [Nitrospinaceae bacterium]
MKLIKYNGFMNIVLLGYRGAGKSVVANILSKKLNRKLIRTDDLIVESAGMPIPRIVEEGGWPRFREIETRVIREVSQQAKNSIIDCGGGVVLNGRNIRLLKRDGKAVLLRADFETIVQRIQNDPNRPPLTKGVSFEEEQKRILAEREPKYLAAADLVCDTTREQPRDTARKIIDYFKKNSWI